MLPGALLDPAIYPHPAGTPVLIETHVSWIVLAGDYAYKFKRPVRFPFLDYSTLPLRRAACEAEVLLNRRWAGRLYLGVAELVTTRAGLRLDAIGTPLEPAVRMRRFDRAQELDALLERAAATPDDLARLGTAVAAWQATAPVVDPGAPWGRAVDVRAAAAENLAALHGAAVALGAADVAAIADWIADEGERVAPALERRRDGGRVRECHGDLHAGNVVRIDGVLTPFDGIEFSARLRTIDVASDAAFLAMDLERRGRADLAAAFLDAWLGASGDYDCASVWRWFLVYRALVRAKIDALRAGEAGRSAAAAAAAWEDCRGYLTAALRHARRGPGLIVLTFGPSGSGKSWLAARLVPALGAVRLRSDVERKRLAGLAASAASGSAPGAGLYGPDATERTYSRLAALAGALARAGVDVLLDATFLDRGQRTRVAQAAGAAGARLAILECRAPQALLRERVAARRDDPSEATLAILERQLRHVDPLTGAERSIAVTVDADSPPDAAALAAALRVAAAPPAG
ncbi:MAG: AAA family ATPase [Proteobacteria bacterium]|nr:AAA family ATPase [Pseudomonadota bacterium]